MLLFRLKRYICNGKNKKYINHLSQGISNYSHRSALWIKFNKNNLQVFEMYKRSFDNWVTFEMINLDLEIQFFQNKIKKYILKRRKRLTNLEYTTTYRLDLSNSLCWIKHEIITHTTIPTTKSYLPLTAQHILNDNFRDKFGI